MKIYRVNDSGALQVADLPDGTLPIGEGATVGADGQENHPITEIDYGRRLYWRGGDVAHTFPERWVAPENLTWSDAP